jgi:hypothetical protein
MNLQCTVELAAKYKAGAQIARVLTEDWCVRELFLPRMRFRSPPGIKAELSCFRSQVRGLRGTVPAKKQQELELYEDRRRLAIDKILGQGEIFVAEL